MKLICKPKDIKTDRGYFGTVWGKCEIETVARNIVINAQQANPDEWQWFTWDLYKKLCEHKISYQEEQFIETLARKGFLDIKGDSYRVNNRFIGVLVSIGALEDKP